MRWAWIVAVTVCLVGCKRDDGWKRVDVRTPHWQAKPIAGTVSTTANFERLAKRFPSFAKDRAEFDKAKAKGPLPHRNFIVPGRELSTFVYYFANVATTEIDKHCQVVSKPTKKHGPRYITIEPTAVVVAKRRWWRMVRAKPGEPPRSEIRYEHCNARKTWTVLVDAVPTPKLADWYRRIEASLASATLL